MNWKWSNVSIRDTIIRECCTVEEAYRRLREIEQELVISAESIRLESIRRASVAVHARERWEMTGGLESDRILAETFVADATRLLPMEQSKYNSDVRAIKFVRRALSRIGEQRSSQYLSLPDEDAFQLCQEFETYCTLMRDVYFSLLQVGMVSPELLRKCHNHKVSGVMDAVITLKGRSERSSSEFAHLDYKIYLLPSCEHGNKLLKASVLLTLPLIEGTANVDVIRKLGS
jgi:hypothetical protein